MIKMKNILSDYLILFPLFHSKIENQLDSCKTNVSKVKPNMSQKNYEVFVEIKNGSKK